MLICNFWIKVGFYNGVISTVVCYIILFENYKFLILLIFVIVYFDDINCIGLSFCKDLLNCVIIYLVISVLNDGFER